MTISHFKAVLYRQAGNRYWYQFYPDIVCAESLSGEFCYHADQETFELTQPVEHPQAQIALAGLTSKLKREIRETGVVPDSVTIIA
jgi:hypothetical protein